MDPDADEGEAYVEQDWRKFPFHELSSNPVLEKWALNQRSRLKDKVEEAKPENLSIDSRLDPREKQLAKRLDPIKALNKEWHKITAQRFVICVNMLGKDVADYLTLLSIPIQNSDWMDFDCMKWLRRARYDQAETLQVLPTNFPPENFSEPVYHWKRGKTPCCYLLRRPQVKMSIHWTAVKALVKPKDIHDQVRIIQALFYCGMDSECFNTVVSKCILENAWRKVSGWHTLDLILDFVFLALLAANSASMIYFKQGPPEWLFWPTILFIARAAMNTVVMFVSHWVELGCMDGFYAVMTKWNIAMLLVEVTNAINLGNMFIWGKHTIKPDMTCDPMDHDKGNGTHPGTQECPLVLHPVKFALAVGLKWIHFIFELMNTKGLGHSVLPAFKAVTGTDALAFMVFLMIIVFGTVQTYWALPIREHLPKDGRSVFALVFMKVFRLELLGDFDISELEGEDPVLKGNWSGDHLSGHIEEAKESELFHDAVMIIVLFASVVVTVLSMNVAIGVVSTAYSNNKANSNQLYCHFQSGYAFKLLLRRAAVHTISPRLYHCIFRDDGANQDDAQQEEDGYFIGFDERWFMDSNDLDEEFELLQETISQNRQKLDNIASKLASGETTDKAAKSRAKNKKRR
mmetsp:Transcript_43989/g.84466  ORF Transcript_43989/g.84466 Transcript_43989/m.84466 type:complete len:630 (-) Transcript_43989:256-2145(-)